MATRLAAACTRAASVPANHTCLPAFLHPALPDTPMVRPTSHLPCRCGCWSSMCGRAYSRCGRPRRLPRWHSAASPTRVRPAGVVAGWRWQHQRRRLGQPAGVVAGLEAVAAAGCLAHLLSRNPFATLEDGSTLSALPFLLWSLPTVPLQRGGPPVPKRCFARWTSERQRQRWSGGVPPRLRAAWSSRYWSCGAGWRRRSIGSGQRRMRRSGSGAPAGWGGDTRHAGGRDGVWTGMRSRKLVYSVFRAWLW